jgi:hypothetical protein
MGASEGQWVVLSHRQEDKRKWEPVRDNGWSSHTGRRTRGNESQSGIMGGPVTREEMGASQGQWVVLSPLSQNGK